MNYLLTSLSLSKIIIRDSLLIDSLPTFSLSIDSFPNKAESKSKSRSNRVIGTPDYIAPEILLENDYNNPGSDFWSLGVMLFEFLVGVPPFNDETVEMIFENIKEMRIPWDDIHGSISETAEDLIRKLLEPDTMKRLNAEQIKKHKFFEGYYKINELQYKTKLKMKNE